MNNIALVAATCLVVAVGCSQPETEHRSDAPDRRTTTPTRPNTRAPADADNTAVNVRDRDGALPTPTDQDSNAADAGTTAAIRKRIMDAKLSVDAQNVKVITENGRVTLRGPVNTHDEKAAIARMAKEVAGDYNVVDMLEVVAAR